MNNVPYLDFLAKGMLLVTAHTRLIQVKLENTSAILAARGSAIEQTRHSMISERVKIKSDWHWRWSRKDLAFEG